MGVCLLTEAICVFYLLSAAVDLAGGSNRIDVRSLDRYWIDSWREACTIVILAAIGCPRRGSIWGDPLRVIHGGRWC
jgi:hypothetical protein